MILGHLAVADLASRKLFAAVPWLFLAAASLGPDFLDKSAQYFLGANGRGPGHSLLVFFCLAALAYAWCRKDPIRLRFFYAGTVLWLGHLACDLPLPEILLWPFAGPIPEVKGWNFTTTIASFYSGQFGYPVLIADLALVAAAILARLARPGAPRRTASR